VVKVVGTSASGKSTLVTRLRRAGYNARPISQEHSNVPDLWSQFDRPAALIFLHVDVESQQDRRPDVAWSEQMLRRELDRLADARAHADLRVDTSALSPDAVFQLAVGMLERLRIAHAATALDPLPITGGSRGAP
jgi:hypothetical protein